MSFSTAIETLARIGLGEPAATALTPALANVIQRELGDVKNQLARPILYTGVESSAAARIAGETLHALQPADADARVEKARVDAGRRLGQLKTGALFDMLYQERQRMLTENVGQENALNDVDAASPTELAADK